MNARVILVTGANSLLGQAIARKFLEEADSNLVWLGVRQRRDRAETLCAAFPNRCFLTELDVASPSSWSQAVEKILCASHRVDVLVNNAGKHDDHLLGTMPPEVWHSVLDINLNGVFYGCQAVLPAMISQRTGRIINIASLSGWLAPAGQSNYAAAKAGVIALTQSLAKEVARIGITVNAICPGYIETEALEGWTDDQRKAALSRIPMRRFARPEEVAHAVRFLSCPESGYITGSTLKIDGGIF